MMMMMICLGFQSDIFSSGNPIHILYAFIIFPIHDKCPVHIIYPDMIIVKTFDVQ